jgi:hypothetical protein
MPGVATPSPTTGCAASAHRSRATGEHEVVRVPPPAARPGPRAAEQDAAAHVDERGAHLLVVGQVEGGGGGGLGAQPDERGRLADPGLGPRPHLLDEPGGDQLPDQGGHGDGGEAALAGDVGPAARPTGEQRLQDQRAVVASRVGGQDLRRAAQRWDGGGGHIC